MRKAIVAFLLITASAPAADDLIVCGWDEVYILNVSTQQRTFSWKAAARPELPPAYRDRYRTTDDCKAVAGDRILITASSDGVALVDRATGRTTFWAQCANAHSAELLPGERIAVACSVREQGGNRLALFDARTPEKEIFSTELYSGHGALWDGKTLWALGGRELRAYSLEEASLKLEGSWPLPSPGGHELSPGDSDRTLTVSASRDAWLFDRETKQFHPHPLFAGNHHVKSASRHPKTGRWAYTLADSPNWWTSKIRLSNPEAVIERMGERLYKVRWVDARH